jgi:hypothetical protein
LPTYAVVLINAVALSTGFDFSPASAESCQPSRATGPPTFL